MWLISLPKNFLILENFHYINMYKGQGERAQVTNIIEPKQMNPYQAYSHHFSLKNAHYESRGLMEENNIVFDPIQDDGVPCNL